MSKVNPFAQHLEHSEINTTDEGRVCALAQVLQSIHISEVILLGCILPPLRRPISLSLAAPSIFHRGKMTPSILIIGGGAFGTSTAYHLSTRGYTRVKVLDRFGAPSKDAAATDLNKIVRYDYPNPLYTKLGLEAMGVWKSQDHVLSGMFNHTGWLMAAHEMTQDFLKSAYESSQKAGLKGVRYVDVEEIKQRWPQFTGTFNGWTNLWSPEAGWVSLDHKWRLSACKII